MTAGPDSDELREEELAEVVDSSNGADDPYDEFDEGGVVTAGIPAAGCAWACSPTASAITRWAP